MNWIARSFAVVLLLAPALRAQVQRGTIRGTVRDSLGHPLGAAQLVVTNTDIRAISDGAGHYVLSGVWPGPTEVQAKRIGSVVTKAAVMVRPGDTTIADIILPPFDQLLDGNDAVTLDPVMANAAAPSARMAGFEQRRARGVGGFITRADIERRHPNSLSDMLRGIAGVSIKPNTSAGEQAKVQIERSSRTIGSGACEVQLYVDGHPYLRGNVDDFPPETVEGVEVYRGGSELPSEFRSQNSGCGLIAIWTRDPSAMRGRPELGR